MKAELGKLDAASDLLTQAALMTWPRCFLPGNNTAPIVFCRASHKAGIALRLSSLSARTGSSGSILLLFPHSSSLGT